MVKMKKSNVDLLKKITSVTNKIFSLFEEEGVSKEEATVISDIIYRAAVADDVSNIENIPIKTYFVGDNHGWGFDPSLYEEEH